MRCPFCHSGSTQVRDSRPGEDGDVVRRRRHCLNCGTRFTTVERVLSQEFFVVKRDGSRELFQRDKLARSVSVALRRRKVDEGVIDRIISDAVCRIEESGKQEVRASDIGRIVLDLLRDIDVVAYIRFASVYKNFQNIQDFLFIVGEIESDENRK